MKDFTIFSIAFAVAMIFAHAGFGAQVNAQDFVIFADNNNLECLEVENDSQANSTRLMVTDCRDHHVQTFKIENSFGFGAGSSIVNMMTSRSRCLEMLGATSSNGIALTQWQCDRSPQQSFRLSRGFDPSTNNSIFGQIQFTHSGKCFDMSDRPFIEQQPCNGSSSQIFRIMRKTQSTIDQMEQAQWNRAQNSGSVSVLNQFISNFPSSNLASLARNEINKIQNRGGSTPSTSGSTSSSNGSAASNVEQQFWDLIKASNDVNDFRSYLTNFPGGAHTAHANLRISQLTRSPGTTSTGNTGNTATGSSTVDPVLEQQFWDLVKDSKNPGDFQSYLSNFPTGGHAALARLQISRLGGTGGSTGSTNGSINTTNNSPNSGSSSDAQFLRDWANKLQAQMPITIRDIQLSDAVVLTSSNSLEIQGSPTSFAASQSTLISQANDLKPFLLGQYCSSGAPQRNIRLVSRTFDAGRLRSLHAYTINPGDCSGSMSGTGSTGGVNPVPGGTTKISPQTGSTAVEEQFWDAVKSSRRVEDFQSYIDNFPTGKYIPLAKLEIGRLGGTVKSSGTTSTSGSTNTTTASNVEEQFWDAVKNSNSEQDYQRYLSSFPKGKYVPLANLKISQIRSKSGTTTNSPPANTNTRTDAQILAAAQPGNLGELGTKRKFFVVSNDFNVKRNIADEIRKLVPQLTVALSETDADFFIAYKSIDKTTGAEVANDPANPNLQGDMWVFTIIPASGNFPANIRLHRRIIKDRGFGVFSRTPDINSAKDLAKELQQVIR
ncbi:MAG: RICIN domain-containing protein [Acidobacteria bacterium]|nr:RICIN domain-containing protein [Acidobacteriota bacterium]